MNSNSNELSKDSLDSDLQDFDDPDKGFELDKLEIPKPPVKPQAPKVTGPNTDIENQGTSKTETSSEPKSSQEPTRVTKPKKGSKLINLLVISGGLVILLSIIGFFAIKLMQPNMAKVSSGNAKVGIYQAIEPIVTNIGDNRYVYISLMLRPHSEQNTHFMALQSKVKDAVFNFLGSADFKRQIGHGGSAKMKSVLYNELNSLLEEKYPNQAILSEIRLN